MNIDNTLSELDTEIQRIKTWLNSSEFHVGTRMFHIAHNYRVELKKLYRDLLEAKNDGYEFSNRSQ